MPTPEEIKNFTSKLASEYAKEILSKQPIKAHAIPEIWAKAVADTEKPLAELFEPLIAYIAKDYCIVPKSKLKEHYKDVCEDIEDYNGKGVWGIGCADMTMYQRARGMKQMLYRLFGKSLFEDTK